MITAAEVLGQYARLTRDWRNPERMLVRYVDAFSDDVRRKRGLDAYISMFSPLHQTRDAELWVKGVGRDLYGARVYQVTEDMCRAVTQMYQKSTAKVDRICLAELPSPSGFVWLDEPPVMRDRRGKVTRDRAISWNVMPVHYDGQVRPGIRIMLWADITVEDGYTADWAPGMLKKSERHVGRLQMQHVYLFPLDAEMLPNGDDYWGLADNNIAWLHTLFMLLGTEIPATQRANLSKGAIGAVRQHVKYSAVTVVTLRHVTSRSASEDEPEHRDVDWQHRWIVQGHHRHLEAYLGPEHTATPVPDNQRECAVCHKRITWVKPHVKGPDGKPMKVTDMLYRLRR